MFPALILYPLIVPSHLLESLQPSISGDVSAIYRLPAPQPIPLRRSFRHLSSPGTSAHPSPATFRGVSIARHLRCTSPATFRSISVARHLRPYKSCFTPFYGLLWNSIKSSAMLCENDVDLLTRFADASGAFGQFFAGKSNNSCNFSNELRQRSLWHLTRHST